jgi:pimeloyl-ACP methyl ester carboxylesterase
MLKRRAPSKGLALAVLAVLAGASPALAAADVVTGTLGPGAQYRLVRPDNWNGTLFLYAHGFVSSDEPVGIPPEVDLITSLLVPQGVAVAVSSFSFNGWAVKDGTQRTHQLLGIFKSRFGSPARVYAAGASMGGLIAIRLAETYSGQFTGLLSVCPAAGGLRVQLDYVANVRVLFDLFYPGVLPGTVVDIPPGLDVATQIVAPALAAMTADPEGALAIARVAQTPVPFANAAELAQSIVTALVGAANAPDILRFTHDKQVFDNLTTVYTGALPPAVLAMINASVQRYSALPAGLNYVEHNYTPSGNLAIPALMLSTNRDAVLPGFHLDAYAAAVAEAGSSDLLVQRRVPGSGGGGYGHCTFTSLELAKAFGDLVLWTEFGVKPTP